MVSCELRMASPLLDDSMHHVYLLRSLAESRQTYIGLTDDMRARLKSHNEGANFHTAKYRPWALVCCISFKSRERAAELEKYLKAGSGHAFAHRHLW